MGFFSRLFGGRQPVEPSLSGHADVGLTDDFVVGSGRPEVETAEGHDSAVDELGRETGGLLLPGMGSVFESGADVAVRADIGADMRSDGDRLDAAEEHMWDALAADSELEPGSDPGDPGSDPGDPGEPD